MKRFVVLLSLLAVLLVPLAAASTGRVAAVDVLNTCGAGSANGTPTVCVDGQSGEKSKTNPIVDVIRQVIQILAYVIGVASIIGLIISGIRMATANGDSSGIATARTSVIYCLVGVAVAVLAQVIVSVVLSNVH